MRLLEERIRTDGLVLENGVLMVDRFLNHQMDINLFIEMAREWRHRFEAEDVTKILTIESSGIGIACVVAEQFNCPAVFAKKYRANSIAGEVYTAQLRKVRPDGISSIAVSKQFLRAGDKVLLIDDFLANGATLEALVDLVRQSGATLVGAGVAVEKAFQGGGERVRSRGVRVEALARIKQMSPEGVTFC